METMETKEMHLYKVYAKGWNTPVYVAADNQQQAVDKVSPYYNDLDPRRYSVDFVDGIIV